MSIVLSDSFVAKMLMDPAVTGRWKHLADLSKRTVRAGGCGACNQRNNAGIFNGVRSFVTALPPSEIAVLKGLLKTTEKITVYVPTGTGNTKIEI